MFELMWIAALGVAGVVAVLFVSHWLSDDDTSQSSEPASTSKLKCESDPDEVYDSRVAVSEKEYERIKKDLDIA